VCVWVPWCGRLNLNRHGRSDCVGDAVLLCPLYVLGYHFRIRGVIEVQTRRVSALQPIVPVRRIENTFIPKTGVNGSHPRGFFGDRNRE